MLKKFIAASLKGWSFALDNPAQDDQAPQGVFPEVNEKLATQRARRDHAAVLQRRRQYHRQGRGRAVDDDAGTLLSEVKLLPAGQDPKTYYTNDYLPPDRRNARLQEAGARSSSRYRD